MKILSIIGARPQFIKAATVSRKIRDEGIKEILVHTGQHYDFNMSDIFFQELNLPDPDYYLGVGSGSHGEQTGRMLMEIEKVLLQKKPNVVLVYGDTNTTLAGSLAAAKLHIPVAHIEAGLRSYNRSMPEEINRVLTDHCSDILFCPTETAVKNLQKEGFVNVAENGKLINDDFSLAQKSLRFAVGNSHSRAGGLPLVINVGDVMFDIALEVKKITEVDTDRKKRTLERYFLKAKDYILATIHRADNTDNKGNLQNIMGALEEIARRGMKIFFPAHPRTMKALKELGSSAEYTKKLTINEPVSYVEMNTLCSNAKLIITDSGGLQKEAYFFKVPCVIPRNETEWTELVEIGWNKVAGTKTEDLLKAALSTFDEDFGNKVWVDFYGSGRAGDRVVRVLSSYERQ
ncbi:MAG: UDP-N-acetyl glucosamine 2-epimerase [Planctomycetota bacterium]|jgi:UDP-N-acetylglucosamine 2-epimerase